MGSTSTNLGGVSLRKKDNIFLIGYMSHQITGSKLPSNGQVLRSLFYNLRQVKLDIKNAAKLTIEEVLVFWQKARIPTKQFKNCVLKLEKLYEEWRKLQKNATRVSKSQDEKIKTFKSILDDLFDVAHQDALKNTSDEDRQFLILQRQKGRVGCMGGIDIKFLRAEERKSKRKAAEMVRQENWKLKSIENEEQCIELSGSSTSDEEEEDIEKMDHSDFDSVPVEDTSIKEKNYSRGSKEILTEKLCVLLDRCNVSDRDAVRIIAAAAEALDANLQELSLSRTTVRARRQKFREQRANIIKNRFQNSDFSNAVLHWDGKLVSHSSNKDEERLAVLISCGDEEQLIGVPEIENSKGLSQAKAVFSEINKWGAAEKIEAMCFDTTAANTGCWKGTCTLLEQYFEKYLLYLACRHHILELLLKAVFESKFGATTGPQPEMFKKFQMKWPVIDKKQYKFGIEDPLVKIHFSDLEEISGFLLDQLEQKHPREDYKEFLQLCLIFLGRVSPDKISFRAPGAIHHARWMAKAIYSLKIYIFRQEFSLTPSELESTRSVCIFILKIYVKHWFTAPDAAKAPNNDLQLCKKLVDYKTTDENASNAAIKKLVNHLWYLNPEQVCFALFDPNLKVEIKVKMASKLLYFKEQGNEYEEVDSEKRTIKANIPLEEIQLILNTELDHFITPSSLYFFKRFKLSTDFLKSDPSVWEQDTSFLKGKNIVRNLRVVNDTAERGVKLIQDYSDTIRRDEKQKQYLLQIISECRKIYPDVKKSTLEKPLPST